MIMRRMLAKLRRFCVKEKGHLVVGGGYIATTFWGGHNSVLMAGAYGVAAIMATHIIHRANQGDGEPELRHQPKHLARD